MQIPKRLARIDRQLDEFQKRLESWRNRRLLLSLVFFAVLVLATFWRWAEVQALSIVIFLIFFIPMVSLTKRIGRYLARLRCLRQFYERQQQRASGRATLSPFPVHFTPTELQHGLNRDLNLFSGSGVFGLWDEFLSVEAAQKATDLLVNTAGSEQLALDRHQRITKIATYAGFLRKTVIIGQCNNDKRVHLKDFKDIIQQEGLPPSGWWLCLMACLIWLALVVALVVSTTIELGPLSIAIWALFALVSLMSLGGAHRLFAQSLTLQGESHCSELFARYEKIAALQACQGLFPGLSAQTVSKSLSKVERLSNFLSTLAHPIIHIGLNIILPWSAFFSLLMEYERKKLRGEIDPVCKEFAVLDELSSSAFLYKWQTQVFPKFDSTAVFSGEGLFHPLLDRTNAVANTFGFPQGSNQILITGSNMSGKSTFLRTVALNQVLALAGLPVFAKAMVGSYSPVVTCIQVSDSLSEGLSSFYAEVVCLRRLYERIKKEEVFYFVDEIFRGTNNRERLIGSSAFLQELSKYSSRGFVTTHDLELAELESTLSGLANYHFRDEIEEGRMRFPYKIFDGVCPTTNALKIMKAEGLPV